MAHQYESGFMVNQPSWHQREKSVFPEGQAPTTWLEARTAADLLWDVETEPVFTRRELEDESLDELDTVVFDVVPGWQAIRRDDTKATLAVQQASYAVIRNEAFGEVIDAVMGRDEGEEMEFEALMSLYGGKQIIALMRWKQAHDLPWDPSKTYLYLAFVSRHDGQGGLRILPTNVRVQCANTLSWAESTDGRTSGVTIRHTSNWEDRVAQAAAGIALAKEEGELWTKFMADLAGYSTGARQREVFLKRLLPISDADTMAKIRNAELARDSIRRILASPTCQDISGTGYGLLMAATEWTDHVRPARTVDSGISRQLLVPSTHKASAAKILKAMARA